jgi:hypothetical protein
MRTIPWPSHAKIRYVSGVAALICLVPSSTMPAFAAVWTPAPTARSSWAVGAPHPPWLPCGFHDDRDKVIKIYSRPGLSASRGATFSPGPATLRCGSPEFGFRHILARHRNDWRAKASLTEDTWLDLADFAITAALTDPDRTVYSSRNNTFCFSRTIYLINNRSGQRAGTVTPNIIVGYGTLNVVTAYPSTEQCRE